MSLIPTFTSNTNGGAPNYQPAAAGDTAPVGTGLSLIVRNTTAGPIVVTMAAPGNLATGDPYPDKQYTVGATTGEQWIPLLPDYADADGLAHITYGSTPAGLTRAVVRS